MNAVSNFFKQTMALLTGDKDQAIALKNERRAKAQLKNQLSSLDLHLSKLEDQLEQAEDSYTKAKFPTELIEIENGEHYLRNIKSSYELVEKTKNEIEEVKESIKFWENLRDEFDRVEG